MAHRSKKKSAGKGNVVALNDYENVTVSQREIYGTKWKGSKVTG